MRHLLNRIEFGIFRRVFRHGTGQAVPAPSRPPAPRAFPGLGQSRPPSPGLGIEINRDAASDTALAEVVRRLVAAYHPERIYLFGSVARGDAGPDSDYDLMVVVSNDAPPELRRSQVAYQALGTGVASDVLVWTANQFDSRTHPCRMIQHFSRPDILFHSQQAAERRKRPGLL